MVMVRMIIVDLQNFKLSAFLFLEILRHKVTLSRMEPVIASPPPNSPGIDQHSKKITFIPENVFLGPRLYPLMYLSGFQAKQNISYPQFLERSHLQNNCSNPPGELIVLKFCKNVLYRQESHQMWKC